MAYAFVGLCVEYFIIFYNGEQRGLKDATVSGLSLLLDGCDSSDVIRYCLNFIYQLKR